MCQINPGMGNEHVRETTTTTSTITHPPGPLRSVQTAVSSDSTTQRIKSPVSDMVSAPNPMPCENEIRSKTGKTQDAARLYGPSRRRRRASRNKFAKRPGEKVFLSSQERRRNADQRQSKAYVPSPDFGFSTVEARASTAGSVKHQIRPLAARSRAPAGDGANKVLALARGRRRLAR